MSTWSNDATLDLDLPVYKPTLMAKVHGTLEEMSGKLKGNPSQIAEGKMKRHGTYESMYESKHQLESEASTSPSSLQPDGTSRSPGPNSAGAGHPPATFADTDPALSHTPSTSSVDSAKSTDST